MSSDHPDPFGEARELPARGVKKLQLIEAQRFTPGGVLWSYIVKSSIALRIATPIR